MSRPVGRPKSKDPKRYFCRFRVTAREKNRIKTLAQIYSGGDESRWLLYAALNCRRKALK